MVSSIVGVDEASCQASETSYAKAARRCYRCCLLPDSTESRQKQHFTCPRECETGGSQTIVRNYALYSSVATLSIGLYITNNKLVVIEQELIKESVNHILSSIKCTLSCLVYCLSQ
jgi:hypothetical protein